MNSLTKICFNVLMYLGYYHAYDFIRIPLFRGEVIQEKGCRLGSERQNCLWSSEHAFCAAALLWYPIAFTCLTITAIKITNFVSSPKVIFSLPVIYFSLYSHLPGNHKCFTSLFVYYFAFLGFYINEIIHYSLLLIWLLSFSIIILRFICVMYTISYLFLLLNSISLCGGTTFV